MSKYTIRQIDRKNDKDYKLWKNGLKNFDGATIFHDPDFLSYHVDKFKEYHLGIFKGNELFGLIPFAIIDQTIKSPYGASYGGFIFKEILTYHDSKEIMDIFLDFCKKHNFTVINITPSLNMHYKKYSQTFLFSMLEKNFKIINSDITSVVFLTNDNLKNFNSRAKRAYKKSSELGLIVKEDGNIDDFFTLMEKTFLKHGVAPTHSRDELIYLKKQLPEDIKFPIVYFNEKPIATICEFKINNSTIMSFYICQDDEYKHLNAQTFLIKNLLDNAYKNDFIFYDFGTSSVNMLARENIFSFKEGFGSKGVFRHSYQLEIDDYN